MKTWMEMGKGDGGKLRRWEGRKGGRLKNTVEFLAPIRYCLHRIWSHVVRIYEFSVAQFQKNGGFFNVANNTE
jgi:hypothetical protein